MRPSRCFARVIRFANTVDCQTPYKYLVENAPIFSNRLVSRALGTFLCSTHLHTRLGMPEVNKGEVFHVWYVVDLGSDVVLWSKQMKLSRCLCSAWFYGLGVGSGYVNAHTQAQLANLKMCFIFRR